MMDLKILQNESAWLCRVMSGSYSLETHEETIAIETRMMDWNVEESHLGGGVR